MNALIIAPRLRRYATWLVVLMMVMMAAPLVTPRTAGALNNVNYGNPYTNGDMVRSTHGYNIWALNYELTGHTTQIEYTDPPNWPLPMNVLNAVDPDINWAWGLSDFWFVPDAVPLPPVNMDINLYSPLRTHCCIHDRETSGNGADRALLFLLENMTYQNGVYTGTFILYVQGRGDQAQLGLNKITIIWLDYGNLKITKASADTAATQNNSAYSLSGAKYGVYLTQPDANAGTNRVTAVTLSGDSSASGTSVDLEPATYYVKEIPPAPKGYELDSKTYSALVPGGGVATLNVTDVPLYSWVDLIKQSANPALSNNNSCYKLSGAIYTVYKNASASQKVTTITTDANGYGKSAANNLPAGSYWVKETTPATGYALDPAVYAVTVAPGDTVRVNSSGEGVVKDCPQNDPIEILIGKVDAETGKSLPLGGASLADAQFAVKYYDGYYNAANLPDGPLRSWVVQTGDDGTAVLNKSSVVAGDALYASSTGRATLPLGTVTIQEIKAPTGYLLGNQPVFIRQITSEGTVESVNTYNAPTAPEQVKRGDLELLKAVATSYQRMAKVPFKITSVTTNESHVIVTDANGRAATETAWNPHSQNTNAGATADDGVWFGVDKEGDKAPVNDALGALPYDTYLIEELRCAENADYQLIAPFKVTISRDTYVVDLGTLTDAAPVLPEIGTQATDADSGTQNVIAAKNVTVIDTVSYTNLEAGREYRLEGALMDQSTETTLVVAGQPVTAEVVFCPSTPRGIVEVAFNFDASALEDARIVVFESLRTDEKVVASHADISNGSQTVLVIAPTPSPPPTREPPTTVIATPEPSTTVTSTPTSPKTKAPRVPSTGDAVNPFLALALLLALASIALVTALMIHERRPD